jgi:hypothetical protein
MRHLMPLLPLCLITGCVTTEPRYQEVTLLDNGNYAISSQAIDAFQSEREVDQRAHQYCTEQQRDYRKVDAQSSYVNGAGEPLHRVTLYFQCDSSEATVSALSLDGGNQTATEVTATSSALLAIDETDASTGAATASATPVAAAAMVTPTASAVAQPSPEPPFREITALGEGRYGITRQSLEPFQSSRAVQTQAQRYCAERQQQLEEIDRQMRYVNSSGNEQAHRITLYFRCIPSTVSAVAEPSPEPPFREVTALGEGRYGITRQSLEPFQSSRAVQAQAQHYCGERQQHAEEVDRQNRYLNNSSNEPTHRTTLYFRCKP